MTLFSTLIRDLEVTQVVDFTLGSAAACHASLYSKCHYTGIAHNDGHEAWLKDLLNRMFVPLVIDTDVVADDHLVNDASTNLKRSAAAAKKMLQKLKRTFVDRFTGDDDSDADD